MTTLTKENLLSTEIKQFYIVMSNRCNLKCSMCTTTTHPHVPEDELSVTQWRKIVEQLTGYNVKSIGFGGGEPLVRKNDLLEVVPVVASKGIKADIITNGTLVDEDFLERLHDYRDHILFVMSLDGLEPVNDAIRGAGVFKKVMAAAHLFRKHQFQFLFTSVLMPQNFACFVDFMEFIRIDFPECCHDIQPVIPHNEVYYMRNVFSLPADSLEALDRFVAYVKDNYGRLRLNRPQSMLERYRNYFTNTLSSECQCKMGTHSFNINMRGNIWICGKEIEYPLYENSLEKIISSPEYVKEMERVQCCTSPCMAGLVI